VLSSDVPLRRSLLLMSLRLRLSRLLCVVAAMACLSSPAVLAQRATTPSVTGVIAIENARIVQAPGRVIDRGTVVIRDGLIEAVGPNIDVPFDARRIAGDSLVVYAGFIDGLSHAGISQPADNGADERVERPGSPPPDRAGIQPHRMAATMFQSSEASVEQLRSAGFTAAHVVPHGLSMPGKGAVVLLGDGPASNNVLSHDASLFAQFQRARGVYPATDMATLASWRQLYREAARRHELTTRYERNPEGMPRPPSDNVHSAFFPVIQGTQPVVFHVEGDASALQTRRVLELQRTLGFPLILSGVSQAFELSDVLREAGHPVILTLGLPAEPDARQRTTEEESAAPDEVEAGEPIEPTPAHFVSDHRTLTYADVTSEADQLRARQAVQRERYYATAALLHEAGLRFAFSTKDVSPGDVHGNLRRMVEHGLPEDVALAALTVNAADIFGMSSRLGTVERGRIANLVLTNGPLFDEKTRIRYVIVDGVLHRIERQTPASQNDAASEADPVGEWNHTVRAEGMIARGVVVIERSGQSLSGHVTIDALPADMSCITLGSTAMS
jgi:imidazolonepropionase-like amidohydrolase